MVFAKPLADLICELERFPGLGPKSAQRIAYHIIQLPTDDVRRLSRTLQQAKDLLKLCKKCQNFSEQEICAFCNNPKRSQDMICVVSEPKDISAIEKTHEYRGLYHVLHGQLSPMEGIGPEQLKMRELLNRLQEDVTEVIIATNPTLEGDATALYLSKLIKPSGIKVTRLAHGMPIGGELDYADSATLLSAITYRREM